MGGPRIFIDGGSENKSVAEALVRSYRVQQTFVLVYHPQSNGLVERSQSTVASSRRKLTLLIPLAYTLGGPDLCSTDRIIRVWN